MSLRPVPCSVSRAREVVERWHRHHGSSTSGLYAAAVADDDGIVRGVALIGRPVARLLDDGWTLEVTRVATDGTPNACSMLYGIAKRLAATLGYARLITYTREDEPGSSLKAAGLVDEGPTRARSWDMPGRPRIDKTEIVRRRRWSHSLSEPFTLEWPPDPLDHQASLFEPNCRCGDGDFAEDFDCTHCGGEGTEIGQEPGWDFGEIIPCFACRGTGRRMDQWFF